MRLLRPTEPEPEKRSRPTGDPETDRAIWAGDIDWLQRHRGCGCCCFDHTFGWGCPAYAWGGCRGQGSVEQMALVEGYAEHYVRLHGFASREAFLSPTRHP